MNEISQCKSQANQSCIACKVLTAILLVFHQGTSWKVLFCFAILAPLFDIITGLWPAVIGAFGSSLLF